MSFLMKMLIALLTVWFVFYAAAECHTWAYLMSHSGVEYSKHSICYGNLK